jgi:hypothetical protein
MRLSGKDVRPFPQANCDEITLPTVVIKREGKEDNATIITCRVELENCLVVRIRRLLPKHR